MPVRTRGSWERELGRVWRRVAGCGLGFYCSSSLTFELLVQLVFRQLREAQEVDMGGVSSPVLRGCRLLEVLAPYLQAVCWNGPVVRNDRPSPTRCRERIVNELWVQCRVKALWGACGAVDGRCRPGRS